MTLDDFLNINVDALEVDTPFYVYDDMMELRPITKIILDKSTGKLAIVFDY